MIRELAELTWDGLHEWENERRAEIRAAHEKDRISDQTYHDLQKWVSDECKQWLRAWELGLLQKTA